MATKILLKNVRLWKSVNEEIIPNACIYIEDGLIKGFDPVEGEGIEQIDGKNALCLAGFVQTHIHLCQTLFRGIAEDLPLLPWLKRFIWPMEANHNEGSLRASAMLSSAELIRGGTTSFMSMETTRNTNAVFDVVSETGLSGIICHCLMDETGGYDPIAVAQSEAEKMMDDLHAQWKGHALLELGVAPRFALSCSAKNMQASADYARARKLMLHTHSSEQVEEVELVRSQTGMPNIEYLHSVGLTGSDVGLAHCIHTEPHERALLKDTGTKVLHCPSANFKLGSGVAPIPEYLAQGISCSIGADGAPCNNRLDMFMEMREAAMMQKPRLGAEALLAKDVIRMATQGGAEALGMGDRIGTLHEGKRADLILVDTQNIHAVPSDNEAANLVYSCVASDVKLTMVNGQVLFTDGEFKTLDADKLKVDAFAERKALELRAGLRG